MGEVRWEVRGNGRGGGYTGARQGVALNIDERLRRKDFPIAGPPAIRRNVMPLKHKTHSNRPYAQTHTSYQISGEYARGVWLPSL